VPGQRAIKKRIVQLQDRIEELDARIRAVQARRDDELRALAGELAVLAPPPAQ
jgi:hypothetical protein